MGNPDLGGTRSPDVLDRIADSLISGPIDLPGPLPPLGDPAEYELLLARVFQPGAVRASALPVADGPAAL